MKILSKVFVSCIAVSAGVASSACSKKPSVATVDKTVAAAVSLPTTVAIEAATPKVLIVTGLIAADQRTDVSADTAGKVLAVMVERGQRVKQNQPLVRLDTRNAVLGATEARANLASITAQRQLAEEECKRSEALLAKGAITQSQYDREKTSCTSALQQVAAAQARSQMIGKSIADGIVRAPFDGQITQKMASPGMYVGPGVALMTLIDDDPLHIDLSIPEGAIGRVAENQVVELVATSFENKVFKAKVTRISGEVGRTSRAITVEALIEPGSQLLPGMFAEARINIGSEPLPSIPATAVVKRGKTYRAFVVVNGQLEERVVQLGPEPSAQMVSIRSGIVVGDKVITVVNDSKTKITDGMRVQ
jgi:RND family efflux transporter MFP subunit